MKTRNQLAIVVVLGGLIGWFGHWLSSGRWTEVLIIFAFAFLPFIAFDPKRRRATWSKAAFCIVAGVGIINAIVRFLIHSHIIGRSFQSATSIESLLDSARGLILGLLIALLLSGEALGKAAKE